MNRLSLPFAMKSTKIDFDCLSQDNLMEILYFQLLDPLHSFCTKALHNAHYWRL